MKIINNIPVIVDIDFNVLYNQLWNALITSSIIEVKNE